MSVGEEKKNKHCDHTKQESVNTLFVIQENIAAIPKMEGRVSHPRTSKIFNRV